VGFPSSGSGMEEFKFTVDELLFWSAILRLPSD